MHFKVHVVCSLIQLADSGIFFPCNGMTGIMLLTSMLQSDLHRPAQVESYWNQLDSFRVQDKSVQITLKTEGLEPAGFSNWLH